MKSKTIILSIIILTILGINLVILKYSLLEANIVRFVIQLLLVPLIFEMGFMAYISYVHSFSNIKRLLCASIIAGISVVLMCIFQSIFISSNEIETLISNSDYLKSDGAINVNIGSSDFGSTIFTYLISVLLIYSIGAFSGKLRQKKSQA
jgi:hypothetical protein